MSLRVIPVPAYGAEDVVVVPSGPHAGSVFTGTEDGSVWRVAPDGSDVERVARTGGRPLGIEIDGDGRLVICDSHRGLLRVDPASGSVELIADAVEGRPMVFCNNPAVASDGEIWFSDSSTKHPLERWRRELVEDTRTGRLLRLPPGGEPSVVLDGLAFANGVALSAGEDFVAVAETGGRSVVRRWLSGPRAGMRDLLAQNLPGYPDNIARGSDGLIWVTIASPVDPVLERLLRGPSWLRRLAGRLPQRLQPAPKRTVRVQAYDDEARLVHDLDLEAGTPGATYHMVTGVREHDGRVWLGSLHEAAVAVWEP